jgi:FeS assembly SUF system protein
VNFFRRRKHRSQNEPRENAPASNGPALSGTHRPETRVEEGTPMSQPNSPASAPSPSADDRAPVAATPDTASPAQARPMPGTRSPDELRNDVIAVLKTVYDPEIPVDIYELGLIYDVDVEPTGDVEITMTLTTPMCPVAETLPPEVEAKVRDVPGVSHVQLELVWEPPWSMDMMSEAARLELNL